MPARLLFALLFTFNAVFAQSDMYLIIGTYTSGKSEGIYVYKFDTSNADNSLVSTVKASNPSYLEVSPNKKVLYAVNENADVTNLGTGGSITAFSFDKQNGELTEINQQFSGGKHPCYVTVDKTGKWLFAANYSSGNFGLFPVKEDGSIDAIKQLVQHNGTGPDKDRQAAPHVHSTVLSKDNKFLFVADLGIDKEMIYRFDKIKGTLSPHSQPFAKSVPGSGPRHFTFHPNNRYAYLVEEMTGTVAAFKYNNGNLTSIQRVSGLPKDFKGAIGSADIHVSPDGKFLYSSNRGESNSITIFKINTANGKLSVAGHQSTLGKTPRNFNFDPSGKFLLAANQESDDIVIFKINKKTGLLTDTGKRINVPNPVCLKWIY